MKLREQVRNLISVFRTTLACDEMNNKRAIENILRDWRATTSELDLGYTPSTDPDTQIFRSTVTYAIERFTAHGQAAIACRQYRRGIEEMDATLTDLETSLFNFTSED